MRDEHREEIRQQQKIIAAHKNATKECLTNKTEQFISFNDFHFHLHRKKCVKKRNESCCQSRVGEFRALLHLLRQITCVKSTSKSRCFGQCTTPPRLPYESKGHPHLAGTGPRRQAHHVHAERAAAGDIIRKIDKPCNHLVSHRRKSTVAARSCTCVGVHWQEGAAQ